MCLREREVGGRGWQRGGGADIHARARTNKKGPAFVCPVETDVSLFASRFQNTQKREIESELVQRDEGRSYLGAAVANTS